MLTSVGARLHQLCKHDTNVVEMCKNQTSNTNLDFLSSCATKALKPRWANFTCPSVSSDHGRNSHHLVVHPPVYGCWMGGCTEHLSLSWVHCGTGCCVNGCSLCPHCHFTCLNHRKSTGWFILITLLLLFSELLLLLMYLLWCENSWVLLVVLPLVEPQVSPLIQRTWDRHCPQWLNKHVQIEVD